jgi:hypothetical protein
MQVVIKCDDFTEYMNEDRFVFISNLNAVNIVLLDKWTSYLHIYNTEAQQPSLVALVLRIKPTIRP